MSIFIGRECSQRKAGNVSHPNGLDSQSDSFVQTWNSFSTFAPEYPNPGITGQLHLLQGCGRCLEQGWKLIGTHALLSVSSVSQLFGAGRLLSVLTAKVRCDDCSLQHFKLPGFRCLLGPPSKDDQGQESLANYWFGVRIFGGSSGREGRTDKAPSRRPVSELTCSK